MREQDLKNFTITNNFKAGYKDKDDVTKEMPGTAVSGSQNVICGEKLSVRNGYTLLGVANTTATGIKGGGNWKTHSGTQIPWRSYDDELEYYYSGSWYRLANSLTSAVVRGDTWWDTAESQDLMLFVNGDANMYEWSGGITTYTSSTANTITKEGTTTWAEDRFLTAGARYVTINGIDYNYTGGEDTTTLTGVTPDPTGAGHTAGDVVVQKLITNIDTPASGFHNDFIKVLNNQVYVFDKTSREVYISSNSNYTDYTFRSPRLPGEGALVTLDEPPTAAYPLKDKMAISTENYWYIVTFQLSADNTSEYMNIERLMSSPLSGAAFDLAAAPMKNLIINVSSEPTIDTLGNIENIITPQSTNLSDPIKNTMDSYTFTSTCSLYHKNNLYIACSNTGVNNRILIYNLAEDRWEAPQLLTAGILFEYNGNLYMHSSYVPETYKLLDGYTDNNTPITAKWFSPHQNYGLPFNQKRFDTMWIEGYIRPGTNLKIILTYDFGAETKIYELKGTNTNVVFESSGGGLGYYSLGNRNLGGRGETLSASGLRRFRGFIAIPERAFYELQTSFQSAGLDYRWEILSYGFNISSIESQDNTKKIN